MAGTFGSHLLDSYYSFNQSCAPFGQAAQPSQLTTSGPMSFNANMHGTFPSQPSFSSDPSFMNLSEATAVKIAALQAKLNKKLGPEYISQRPGPGGGPKLTYAEGWKVINLANEVFGFNGWSSSVVNLTTDFVDFNEETRRFNVGVSAIVRVTLRDGVFHEDVGYGVLENSKSKGAALDKCKKEAVTDAVKRSLRNFGNLLGNCLYDKQYTQEVIKIKVPPTKFDKSMLHRRPEFDDSLSTPGNVLDTSAMAGPSKLAQNASSANSVINGNASVPKVEGHDSGPLTTLQPHVRPHATGTPVGKSRMPIVQSHSISNAGSGPHPGVRNTPGAGQTSVPNQAVHNNQQIRAQRQSASRPVPPPQPPQSVQLPPPQPNKPQPQAHAPSANSAPTVPDMKDDFDSFMFNSDDDAFLAGVDLGEGDVAADLGRPIDSEEGVGGAIDFDEGAGMELGVSGIGLASSAESNSAAPVNAVDGQNHVRFASGGNGTNNFNKPDIRTSSAKHPAQTTGASTGMHPPPRPSISHANNQGPQSASDASRVKENVDSSVRPGPAAQPHGQNRPQAPVGGFHFPPGINPPMNPQGPTGGRGNPPSMRNPVGGSSLKRSVDAMGNSMSTRTSTTHGMGLAQAQGQSKRQPLAPLEMDGGEVKRARR